MLKCSHIFGRTSLALFKACLVAPVPSQSGSRLLSTLSAIRHGIRRSSKEPPAPSPRASRRNKDGQTSRNRNETGSSPSLPDRSSFKDSSPARRKRVPIPTKEGNRLPSDSAVTARDRDVSLTRARGSNDLKIPYTTPASEFLYGRSTVTAALKANRRKFYKLYLAEQSKESQETKDPAELIHDHRDPKLKLIRASGTSQPDNNDSDDPDGIIKKFAAFQGVQVVRVKQWQVPQLDRVTKGRPHNGVVLEASPIAKLPIKALLAAEKSRRSFALQLRHQSKEERDVNGADSEIKIEPTWGRCPFVIMLDGILDPGNLGAVLRSAFFFGADAVVLSTHNSPLSPVALKASAGASESIPLLSVHSTGAFLASSQANGWKVYAAVPPSGSDQVRSWPKQKHVFTTSMNRPLEETPCVLLIGGEGDGVKPDLLKKANYLISIGGQRSWQGGVDSLNVSVAAAVLCEAFLRQPSDINLHHITGTPDAGAASEPQRDLF